MYIIKVAAVNKAQSRGTGGVVRRELIQMGMLVMAWFEEQACHVLCSASCLFLLLFLLLLLLLLLLLHLRTIAPVGALLFVVKNRPTEGSLMN